VGNRKVGVARKRKKKEKKKRKEEGKK